MSCNQAVVAERSKAADKEANLVDGCVYKYVLPSAIPGCFYFVKNGSKSGNLGITGSNPVIVKL